SNDTGSLRVDWSVSNSSRPARLFVRWEESGGPTVKPPSRPGFGSRLIRGLAQETAGEVRLDYAPRGLICTMDIPLYSEQEMTAKQPSPGSAQRRVLVVEDEIMIRMLLEDMLADLGYRIAASAGGLDEAMTLARDSDFDVAILDVNLNGHAVY